MRDSIHKYFRVGTISWMSYPGTAQEDAIRKIAADDYFDAVEVCAFPDEASRKTGKDLLAQSHLKICYGAQPSLLGPGLNPNDINEEGRKRAEEVPMKAVDEAFDLGAGGIAFLSGKWQENTKDQAYDQLLKTTGNVCRYAAEKNMRVELEVFDYDIDKASLIGPAPLAARFAADIRMKYSNFGLLVDLSHFPLTYENADFVVTSLKPYITHLHFGNAVVKEGCPAYGDKHPRMGYPNSANDVAELLDYFRVLKREGFFRKEEPMVFSMEVSPQKGEDADIILANTKRVLNRAWALLEDD